jgi:hypothetical protein
MVELTGKETATLVTPEPAVAVAVNAPLTVTTLPTRMYRQSFVELLLTFVVFVKLGV